MTFGGEPITRWHLLGGIAGAGTVACIVWLFLVIAGAR